MSQPPEEPLDSWRRKLDALLAELRANGFSGRVTVEVAGWPRMYLAYRCGRAVEAGASEAPRPLESA